MKNTLAILVENKPGVLSRVTGLFSRRGYNIESLAVGPTEDPNYSRITIVVEGDELVVEQITKQLFKLVNVYKVYELTSMPFVERELVMIKVTADIKSRTDIVKISEVFRANVVDVSDKAMILEVTGDTEKIEAIWNLLKPYGVKEMVRTGKLALARGESSG